MGIFSQHLREEDYPRLKKKHSRLGKKTNKYGTISYFSSGSISPIKRLLRADNFDGR